MTGHGPRNDAAVDWWSLTHIAWGILLGWFLPAYWALAIMILWEPLEVFIISPIVFKITGQEFGHESLKNVVSDIAFDVIGVALGVYVLRALVEPPFALY